jgi:hypothetical protein
LRGVSAVRPEFGPTLPELAGPAWRRLPRAARAAAALGAALALIATPIVDVPMWIPVVGEMDAIALSILAAELFVAAAPDHVVREQERLIASGRSRFDHDLAQGRRLATLLMRRLSRMADASVARAGEIIEVNGRGAQSVDHAVGGLGA